MITGGILPDISLKPRSSSYSGGKLPTKKADHTGDILKVRGAIRINRSIQMI